MYQSSTKSYLLVYNDEVGSRESVKNVLDGMATVNTWRYDIPNCFYIVSSSTAQEIVKEFESKTSGQGRYIFTEYNGNAQGRLTEESWYLLNNKAHKPA